MNSKFSLGKYRGIVVSIALFLLLDASVLTLNFFISFKIKEDAVGINIAGRQRMLSQRVMKNLYEVKEHQSEPLVLNQSLKELRSTTDLFNSTLNAFIAGGYTIDTQGNRTLVESLGSLEGVTLLKEAEELWAPFLTRTEIFLNISNTPTDPLFESTLQEAISYGEKYNLELLASMNSLTNYLQKEANQQANNLRMIQVMGISLAIINFFIIMFHFLKQLRSSDEKIAVAKRETEEILDTVQEGLFLLDDNLRIGSQHSSALKAIFGREEFDGMPFQSLLKDVVSEKDMATAESFIKLLFKQNIKQNLIKDLNPLNKVEIHILTDENIYVSKYINFEFSRVVTDRTIDHVLVTATDITEQIELEKALEVAKSQSEHQLTLLSTILHSNMDLVEMFIQNSRDTFDNINELFRSNAKTTEQYKEKANRIFALIHNFKGESSALNLDQFVELAHQFEDQLQSLLDKPSLTGNDFLSLTIQLNNLITQIESCEALVNKLSGLGQQTAAPSSNDSAGAKRYEWGHLDSLAQGIATKQKKQVEVVHSGLNDHDLSDHFFNFFNTLSTQLIRNAVTHGIEPMLERRAKNKKGTGLINIRLTKRKNGLFEFQFQDDGKGLDLNSILSNAVDHKIVAQDKADQLDKKAIVSLIFAPKLSTSTSVDEDSGRGMGMYSVRELVTEAGGKISVGFKPGAGTTFTISLPVEEAIQTEAA